MVVTEAEAIHFLGDKVKPALATPSMILWMEITARDAVLQIGRASCRERVYVLV